MFGVNSNHLPDANPVLRAVFRLGSEGEVTAPPRFIRGLRTGAGAARRWGALWPRRPCKPTAIETCSKRPLLLLRQGLLLNLMRSCFLLFALLWLAGCDSKPAAQLPSSPSLPPAAAPAVAAVARPRTLALADTATPYTTLPGTGDTVQAATRILIKGNWYRLQTSAQTDSARPLRFTYPPSSDVNAPDSAQNNTVTGFEGTYTFRLLRPDGTTQFLQTLKKSDFTKEIGEDMAVDAKPEPPVFSGYLPAFHALAFELGFYPMDSDAGGELLLLLDATTGRVLHQKMARWMGGCNSAMVLSADGRTLLTSLEILQANGRATPLDTKPGREVGGTLLVNGQTVLVAYLPGYDNKGNPLPLKGPNAELLDLSGRKLAAFNLESVDGGLGYQMLAKYVGQTRSHYLFDDRNGKLGVVPAQRPTAARILKLNQLPVFRAPQRPTEVRIHFTTESSTDATFFIDTVSGGLRHRIRKPAY